VIDVQQTLGAALAGRYRIERELGRGGMATVYLAEDIRHRRKVAIKVLHAELSAVIGHERFLKEIQVTAALQHPNILPLFDSGNADGQLFYVMPFVEGESLRERMTRGGISISDATAILRDVAKALGAAHGRGVVHRDIKPENVLLSGDTAVVADFGIAKAIDVSRTQPGVQQITETGVSLGTPAYMADGGFGREVSRKVAGGTPGFSCRCHSFTRCCRIIDKGERRATVPGRSTTLDPRDWCARSVDGRGWFVVRSSPVIRCQSPVAHRRDGTIPRRPSVCKHRRRR
jgi:tRNA A-37 threonylcarbamoyl transferase component Bud32